MTGGNVIFMARRRAQMSQRELAGRLGCRQATIARWERGDRQPSYEDVREVADACGLQLDAHLLPEDRSWWPQIAMQLERIPSERVRRLAPAHANEVVALLELLARVRSPVIVIGEVAGALHGWPLVLSNEVVEVCARADAVPALLEGLQARGASDGSYELPSGGLLAVSTAPPGTTGYGDLARAVEALDLDGTPVQVAGLLDLLRIADASSGPDSRRRALAYRAVLDVHRVQPAARFAHHPGDDDVADAGSVHDQGNVEQGMPDASAHLDLGGLRARRQEILRSAAQHGAHNVRVFGSTARGASEGSSDVDLLVEMEPGRSLLDLVALWQELEDLLGIHVDVLSDGGVSPHLQERISAEAVPL